RLNVVMESKGGKKKSSSNYPQYETPLGYKIEDVRPHGGIDFFRSAAYSNLCCTAGRLAPQFTGLAIAPPTL
ncbi:hypothetical protein KI387_016299, partial [Taxus chinensis]